MATSSPSTKPPEQRSSVSTATLGRLRQEILNGHIPPGKKLNLDQLRLAYNVSLSPLREALSRLVSEGLVLQTEDQRGFYAAPVSRENLTEVTLLRKTLEVMALRLSIQYGDDAWETAIVSSLHRLSKLTPRTPHNQNIIDKEWEYWHREFHSALISACHAPVLLQFCDILHDLSDRYRRMFIHLHPVPRDVHSEHRAIADAVLKREVGKACGLMEQHVELTCKIVLSVLPEQLDTNIAQSASEFTVI